MLGLTIDDPHDTEGGDEITGMGLLPINTVMSKEKITAQVTARLTSDQLFGVPTPEREASGYEIHLGETDYQGGAQSLFELRRAHAGGTVIQDGAQSADGRIWGTYVHGLFDCDRFRHAFLRNARIICGLEVGDNFVFVTAERQKRIDRLADWVESALHMDIIGDWIDLPD